MSELGPVLAGCRVLVTAQRRADELGAALTRRGAEVTVAPALGVVSHVDEAGLLATTRAIVTTAVDALPVDVVVITTGVGFRGWLETAEAAGLAPSLVEVLGRTRLVARGPKALGALQAAGLRADFVAASETSAEIADVLLAEGVAGQRIVVQRHGAGSDGLTERLTAGGAEVSETEVYRWGPSPDPEAVAASTVGLREGGYDAVLFTSAPGAAAWLAGLREAGVLDRVRELNRDGRLMIAGVGPVTTEPLQVAGLGVHVPDRWRMGALARLVVAELGARGAVPTAAGSLQVRARTATLDHRVLELSPSGLEVLRLLASRPDEVVSREQLLAVLPADVASGAGVLDDVLAGLEALGPPALVRRVAGGGCALVGSS